MVNTSALLLTFASAFSIWAPLALGEKGCVVNGRLMRESEEDELNVVYKVVNMFRHCDAANMPEHEACIYATL